VWAAASITAALIERERSGIGQAVTVAGAHGAMVAAAGALTFDPTVEAPPRAGNAGGSAPFYRTYQCGDGEWLFLAALTPRFTDLAFRALDMVDIYDDERLGGRGRAAMLQPANAPWVSERIASVFASDSRDVWLKRLAEAGCPSGPSLARDDWLDHPQLDAIGMRVEVDDPERGGVVMPGVPLVLHATPGRVRGPAPALSTAGGTTQWTGHGWHPGAGATNDSGDGAASLGPLAGVRVLDLGAIIAGPFAGGLLADLGADVIKVEPLTGDSFRGPGFASYNKGQRGIAIDLQNPAGRDVLLRMVAAADLVIDNYRPGVLGRLRIDWSDLAAVNPDIVSISITGFGEGGPLGGEAGFDPVLQAMSGMMSAQGGDAEPVFFTVPVNDVTTAAATALGGLMGLLHRIRGGRGQKITTSLAAMSAFLQAGELVRFDGRPQARVGSRDHRGAGPLDRYYEASDGWVRVHAADSGHAEAVRALGLAPGNQDALATWIAARTRAEAADALNAAGIAAAAARAARELAADPNVEAFDMLRPDIRAGREHMRTTGRHAKFSRTLLDRDLVAPALGEHSIEVLREAGYTEPEIDTLIADGVVGVAQAPAGS
jgi:crotonobetainyl-CoA:carnitine CoA-transferase CaiB-like acyl-CoA transferase